MLVCNRDMTSESKDKESRYNFADCCSNAHKGRRRDDIDKLNSILNTDPKLYLCKTCIKNHVRFIKDNNLDITKNPTSVK
jgi:hypothetical protein